MSVSFRSQLRTVALAVLSGALLVTGATSAAAAPGGYATYQYRDQISKGEQGIINNDKPPGTCTAFPRQNDEVRVVSNQSNATLRVWKNADCTGKALRVPSGHSNSANSDDWLLNPRSVSFDKY
jgi:hypothetical protein